MIRDFFSGSFNDNLRVHIIAMNFHGVFNHFSNGHFYSTRKPNSICWNFVNLQTQKKLYLKTLKFVCRFNAKTLWRFNWMNKLIILQFFREFYWDFLKLHKNFCNETNFMDLNLNYFFLLFLMWWFNKACHSECLFNLLWIPKRVFLMCQNVWKFKIPIFTVLIWFCRGW